MIVIPLAVTFSAIICAGAVQKRWQMRNDDNGNKYNRLAHKSRRFRQLADRCRQTSCVMEIVL
jgi:hypothetical protein